MKYSAFIIVAASIIVGCSPGAGTLNKSSAFSSQDETAVLSVDFDFIDRGVPLYKVKIAAFDPATGVTDEAITLANGAGAQFAEALGITQVGDIGRSVSRRSFLTKLPAQTYVFKSIEVGSNDRKSTVVLCGTYQFRLEPGTIIDVGVFEYNLNRNTFRMLKPGDQNRVKAKLAGYSNITARVQEVHATQVERDCVGVPIRPAR